MVGVDVVEPVGAMLGSEVCVDSIAVRLWGIQCGTADVTIKFTLFDCSS